MTPSTSSLVLYLQEIYFFDAILPSFGIHQVEYLSRDQKESEREDREGRYGTFKKCEMDRKQEKKLNRKHGCCYVEDAVGVTTGV